MFAHAQSLAVFLEESSITIQGLSFHTINFSVFCSQYQRLKKNPQVYAIKLIGIWKYDNNGYVE